MNEIGFLLLGMGLGSTACGRTGWFFVIVGIIFIIFGIWRNKQEND